MLTAQHEVCVVRNVLLAVRPTVRKDNPAAGLRSRHHFGKVFRFDTLAPSPLTAVNAISSLPYPAES